MSAIGAKAALEPPPKRPRRTTKEPEKPVEPETVAERASGFPKQAIVVVHGMGEQRPMDTIKSFVDVVWRQDEDATRNGMPSPNAVWSKPDDRTGSLELRRIATRQSAPSPGVFDRGVRTDFFELYWADLTAGSPWEEFVAWFRGLLLRDPHKDVPPRVLLAWYCLWVLTIAFGLVALLSAIPDNASLFGWTLPNFGSWRWLAVPVIAGAGAYVHALIARTFGRVARYTRASPNNIAAREQIRRRGLALLDALHNNPEYERIVVVGHSLGTIVAYELLAFFWAQKKASRIIAENSDEFDALCALEDMTSILKSSPNDRALLAKWSQAQRALRFKLARRQDHGARWKISDFVTLGSPLTHAEFLMATDRNDLDARQLAREMPVSPPVREVLDQINLDAAKAAGKLPIATDEEQTELFCFPSLDANKTWELHHAALFAVVRWTNIYDPSSYIYQGDLISGPLQDVFGPAIHDVDLATIRGASTGFTHTKYWDPRADPAQLKALRDAINILDQPRQDWPPKGTDFLEEEAAK
jgi:hypothetical protein